MALSSLRPIGRRRLAAISVGIGASVILVAGRLSPIAAPPLYDGVVTIDPYRWLHPPAGQAGSPQAASMTITVDQPPQSPLVAVATPESPPQAQIFAPPGGLTMPAGVSSLQVTITPVDPVAAPSDGQVAGNVYRVVVTSQAGAPLSAPASARVSIVLRSPIDLADATIERFNGSGWQPLKTDSAGFASTYVAVVTDFGDFALVTATGQPASVPPSGGASPPSPVTTGGPTAAAPPAPSAGGGFASFLPLIVAAVAIGILAGAALQSRRSPPPPPVQRRRPPRRRR
jgi:hypothetical protein